MTYHNSISKLYDEKRYADALNVMDWYRFQHPKVFTPDGSPLGLFNAADAAFQIGDYYRSDQLYRELLASEAAVNRYPDQARLGRRRVSRFEQMRPEAVNVRCDDDDGGKGLMDIMRHLMYTFPRISRPVVAHIVDSETQYRELMIQTGEAPENIFPFKNIHACGFYHSAPVLRLVFKREYFEQYDRDMLTGTLAHEFAHLELYCIRMDAGQWPIFTPPDLVREHQTDLAVVSKGLAFPLYCVRKKFKNHFTTMSADTLEAYLKDLAGYYTR